MAKTLLQLFVLVLILDPRRRGNKNVYQYTDSSSMFGPQNMRCSIVGYKLILAILRSAIGPLLSRSVPENGAHRCW